MVLKVVPFDAQASRPAAIRFQSEAKLLAGMRHQHVLSVLDFGFVPGIAYLVYPDEGGKSLDVWIKDRLPQGIGQGAILPLNVAARILCEALDGLGYVHARGIVHRDLKPANLLVAADGTVKVFDFGLAKDLGSSEKLTETGALMGTPHYMAPDQIRGLPPDPRDDLYSLGVIAYELFSGRRLFPGKAIAEVFSQHLAATPEPLRQIRPELSEELSVLVSDMLGKARGDRPETAAIAAERLRSAMRSEKGWSDSLSFSLSDMPDLAGLRGPEPPDSNRWLVLAGTGTAALVATLLWLAPRPPAEPVLAGMPPTPTAAAPTRWDDPALEAGFEEELERLGPVLREDALDPQDWARVVGRLSAIARFQDWVRDGGLVRDGLPEASRQVLARLDQKLEKRAMAPFFAPYLLPPGPPEPVAYETSADGTPIVTAGGPWLAEAARHARTASELEDRLTRTLARLMDMNEIEGIPPELVPVARGAVRSWALIENRPLPLGKLGISLWERDLKLRPIWDRWIREGTSALRRFVHAAARSIEAEPATREVAALASCHWFGNMDGLFCSGIAGMDAKVLLGTVPSSPAGFALLGGVLEQLAAVREADSPDLAAELVQQARFAWGRALFPPLVDEPVGARRFQLAFLRLLALQARRIDPQDLAALFRTQVAPLAATHPLTAAWAIEAPLVVARELGNPRARLGPLGRAIHEELAKGGWTKVDERTRTAVAELASPPGTGN